MWRLLIPKHPAKNTKPRNSGEKKKRLRFGRGTLNTCANFRVSQKRRGHWHLKEFRVLNQPVLVSTWYVENYPLPTSLVVDSSQAQPLRRHHCRTFRRHGGGCERGTGFEADGAGRAAAHWIIALTGTRSCRSGNGVG